jgi:hypothetical protein
MHIKNYIPAHILACIGVIKGGFYLKTINGIKINATVQVAMVSVKHNGII